MFKGGRERGGATWTQLISSKRDREGWRRNGRVLFCLIRSIGSVFFLFHQNNGHWICLVFFFVFCFLFFVFLFFYSSCLLGMFCLYFLSSFSPSFLLPSSVFLVWRHSQPSLLFMGFIMKINLQIARTDKIILP